MYKLVHLKHADAAVDLEFKNALQMQGFMIISFMLAMVWVFVFPFKYHPIGYVFLMVAPILHAIFKKKK